MILKMYQIIPFENFYTRIKSCVLPIKISYKFSKLARAIEQEKTFYQSKVQEIIEEYGERDENGELKLTDDKTAFVIKEDKVLECQQKMNELLELEIDIEEIKFSIDDLEDLKLSPQEMDALIPFITE